jgi:hypothetical protein
MKTVTVVYEVVDEGEWGKRNPLRYEHDGLKAVRVGIGDALDARDALTELMPFVEEDYYPEFAMPAFKAAVEHAKGAVEVNGKDDRQEDSGKTVGGVFRRVYCPFCGGETEPLHGADEGGARCLKCGATGNMDVAAWKARHGKPNTKVEAPK